MTPTDTARFHLTMALEGIAGEDADANQILIAVDAIKSLIYTMMKEENKKRYCTQPPESVL